MVLPANTFVLSVFIGVIIGSITASFTYGERGRIAAFRTFLGWFLAFAIAGIVATPIGQWILANAL